MEGKDLLTHAGVLATWGVEEACARARRVEAALRSDSASLYLEAFRPTSQAPGEAFGIEPEVLADLRVFTLMRTVDSRGCPTYDYTGPLASLPAGHWPWFQAPRRGATCDVRIVCGHWAALGLVVRPDLAALDTGCAWGGKLTALRLDDGRIEQVENLDR